MIDKRFSVVHSVLFGVCISIMTILMILLFIEYRFFCNQAREMVELKQQYAQYVEILHKKMNGDDVDALEDTLQEIQGERGIDDETEACIVDDIDNPSFDGVPDWNEMEIGVQEASDAHHADRIIMEAAVEIERVVCWFVQKRSGKVRSLVPDIFS